MKLSGTYVWSAHVEVEVPDNASEEEQRMALDEEMLAVELDFKHPILSECSNESLID